MKREFIYFKPFEKNWNSLGLTEKDLEELENIINSSPDAGDIIQGTGGLRKLRFSLPNRGKSGSVRVLYIDYMYYEQVYFLNVYAKNEKENISDKEKQLYKSIIDEISSVLKSKRSGKNE